MTALSTRAIEILGGSARAAERAGHLLPEQLSVIYEQGWFRMLVPRRYGGLELSLPEVVRAEEALSRVDGSVGWTVTLCSGAGWFAGFFPPGVLADLFSDARLCIAGSGTPSGQAHVVPGGYRISGRWAYASGALHATAFTANCTVWSEGKPVSGAAGEPVVKPFLFLPDEVRIAEDWNAVGMVATGSHGFAVDGLVLPAERGFVIDAAAGTGDLYRYPFLSLAEATLAANLSGMMLHFLDCCVASGKFSAGEVLRALEEGREVIGGRREEFFLALDVSWETREPESFVRVSATSHALVAGVRQWCDRLYPYAGLGAARVDTEINRVWRDLHTAGQHPLLVFGSRS